MADHPMQASADQFHMMMGYCIATWAGVDDVLFNIFQECVGPREQCAIIWYRLNQLSGRIELVDEIVRSVLPKPGKEGEHAHPDVKAWEAAKAGYGDLLSTRARIAHQPITMSFEYKKLETAPIVQHSTYFEIAVGRHEKLRAKAARQPSLQLKDLENHVKEVAIFQQRLLDFAKSVRLKRA